MKHHKTEDIVSNALELLSATNIWILVRHQWLINSMRCVLTGEKIKPLSEVYEFDRLIHQNMDLPDHLINEFTSIKNSLENSWLETKNAWHPMSGLSIFDQINQFQLLAEKFMLTSTEANQKLVHEFALRDPLTGARTRLTLANCLTLALQNSELNITQCSIALLDQDRFKFINDHWGHVVGDIVLTKTAEIINGNLRPIDHLFRFGGDEWLIILPSTSKSEAKLIIERIRKNYSLYNFKARNGDVFNTSFSYGIAESRPGIKIEEWIEEADDELYSSK